MPYRPGTNTGHGHVWPRPDGVKARCGGPRLCKKCMADYMAKAAAPVAQEEPHKEKPERQAERERAPLPIPLILSRPRAYALAQMCKRFSYEHASMLADRHDGGEERENILGAVSDLEKILALSLGFKVR